MALNTTLATTLPANSSDSSYQLTGWNPSDNNRGSIDILWSCCITIILCCWVSTFPNIPSPNDKWYHPLVDKFNLACVGFLGPNYLFTIALGQLASARRSVKAFRSLPRAPQGREWTLVHGFFADMGGFVLVSPDYPPFPVNAEQLHYLVSNGHVDFPDLSKVEIKAMSKTDGLSKLIVLWQVFWFSVSTLMRVRQGLPLTTFELTALSFSLTMLITSLCWYAKPTISTPTMIYTKDGRSIEHIRAVAREKTNPGLPSNWYRTPLDFISPHRRFRAEVHWSYYSQLTYMVHLPFFSREIKARPWDRLPYTWLVIDRPILAPAFVIIIAFSLSPLAAWNFYFPTEGEKIAWRLCSVYHAVFSIGVGIYYIWIVLSLDKKKPFNYQADHSQPLSRSPKVQQHAGPAAEEAEADKAVQVFDVEAGSVSLERKDNIKGLVRSGIVWLRSWKNISPDGDPDMTLGLNAIIWPLIATFLYIFCRMFFYIEDFIAIRQQPVDIYKSMNKFIPFIS